MKKSRANKGQFSVIAALLVSVILVTAVISTYTLVRHAAIQDSPKVLTAIGEMNADIKQILDFTVGYYGSILQVTGNSTYARGLTATYLSSGLVNIARSHPEWNPSFSFISVPYVSTRWFMPDSFSMGNISVTYSLANLGIEGVSYETSSALEVTMLTSDPGVARILVTRDGAEPELGLSTENFYFYYYTGGSDWAMVNPTNMIISSSGIYNITLPLGISHDAYSVQVKDNRGLMVSAFYSDGSVASPSRTPHYTYHFDWESDGLYDIYDSLSTDTFAIELLQNGTMKWLGQPLDIAPNAVPIPPVSVKAFRVNATINGVNQEVPFQVEDWASNYMVPVGLAGNDSLFSNNNMIVFLVNNDVSDVTLWWDGNDAITQTHYAWENVYFTDDVSNPDNGQLSNGILDLDVEVYTPFFGTPEFRVRSTMGASTSTAHFLRVNGHSPVFWADTAYIIYNGVVRDIVQSEPEYSGGVTGCPNFYTQIVLTLPANATYYTYSLRTIFVDSLQPRTINDLSVIQLSNLVGTPMTENGTIAIYPNPSNDTGLFYDCSPTGWDHHWSQFVSGSAGAGVMFTNSSNEQLYVFDSVIGADTGAVVVEDTPNYVEVNPVEINSVPFDSARDLTWYGAVVTFNSEPIYRSGDDVGLWVMVEHPPGVMLDGYGTILGVDFVDTATSNVDSSADKGSHSSFVSQKFGPDSIFDTLTEVNTGGTSSVTLIDAESFEGSWPPSGWSETGNWAKEGNQHYDGSYSADFDGEGSGVSGNLVTCDLDCSDAASITVSFRFYDERLESNEFRLECFNGLSWVPIADLTTSPEFTWNLYEQQILDPQYFVSNFKIRWVADGIRAGGGPNNEHAYVDLVTVTKETSQPTSYELDLEVQWTHADFDEANEELCIYVGAVGGENLGVDVWTGSAWQNLFASLNVGWNNATVSSYLTSSTFTIRFIGATETGDATQDYWTIDATLLHCWS
jgi:hypothetical protein